VDAANTSNHVEILQKVNTIVTFYSAYMGWQKLVGSSKLYVSFAKELYKRDHILQKRPIIFKEPTNRSHHIVLAADGTLIHRREYRSLLQNIVSFIGLFL